MPLKGAELAAVVFAGVGSLESLEDCFGFYCRFGVDENLLDPGPVIGKGILAGPPGVLDLALTG